MKGERSRFSPAKKIVLTLTKVQKEQRERDAVQEREKMREEMDRKRQERR